MRKICILLTLLLGLQHAGAADRTEAEILSIAARQLYGDSQRRAAGEAPLRELSQGDRYVIVGTENAFVIVSRDDAFTPVLAVSHTPYQQAGMPDGFYWWLEQISAAMERGSSRRAADYAPVPNMLTSEWGQEDPFNGMCPKVGVSRPPTGCVATAMAQIMKYYQYPAKGTGEGSYTAGSKTRTVTINNEYRWDRMLSRYGAGSGANALQKVAVQYLMADAGAAAGMTYALTGSSATCYDAALGLMNNFQYDSLAIFCADRYLYDDDEWMAMVYGNINRGRPVLYGASDSKSGGHAFVLSGIDAEGKVYVNWGWSGTADGFYDMADLAPVNEGKEMGEHFNESQTMICGIQPSSGQQSADEYRSLWVSPEKYLLKTVDTNRIELVLRSLWNYHLLTFQGTVELYFENLSGGDSDYWLFYDTEAGGAVPSGYGFSSRDDYMRDTLDITPLQPGSYKVYFRSKDVREQTPQTVRVDDLGLYTIKLDKSAEGTIVTSCDSVDPTAVRPVVAKSNDAAVRYYDLQGREVSAGTKGMLIRKQGNKVRKLLVE